MTTDDTLAELLLRWEELHEQGRDVSAEELCRDCPQLAAALADRIRALRVTAWMAGPDDDGGTPPDPPGPNNPSNLAGRYRLDEKVTEGGFAEVWKGFDLELRRAVAVKMPKTGRLHSTERFLAEARRVARLKHPGVVPVFDVGQERESCFIVSEFVEGGSLADRIATQRPKPQDAARMVAEVAETLAYAHRQGFVHRDIKPGNILLDHHGRALLTDFGIAHSPDEGTDGGSFGTLAYMSAEQVEGKPVDHRTDIYGLGVVLHELLTGHLPYKADDPVQLRRLIVAGGVASLPGVSKQGEGVCRKCLSRNPADRYQDAAELAQALRRTAFTQRPARISQRLLALVVVAFIGLIGFFAVRTVLDRNPSPVAEPKATPPNEKRAIEWVYSVGGSVNDTKRIDQLAEPWAVRSVYLHRDRCDGKVTDAGLAQLEGLPDLDTLNLGGAKIDGSGVAHLRESKKLKWLSLECTQVDDAGVVNLAGYSELAYLNLLSTPVTDAAVDVLVKLPRLEMVVVSGTKMTEAGVEKLRKALPSCRVVTDVKAGLKALSELGELHFGKKEWDKAAAVFTEAINLDPQCAEAYHRRAGCVYNTGQLKESLPDFDVAVRLAPKNAEVRKNRAFVYLRLLRVDEALADLTHAQELDPDHPERYRQQMSLTLAQRGVVKAQANKVEEAIADFDEALRLDPNNAELFDKRGSLHFNRKHFNEAVADFTEAVRLDPKTPAYRLHLEMSRNPPNPK